MKLKAVSGIMLILLFIGMLTLAFDIQPVKAQLGTIYIRADGSVDPPTANITSVDNVTYYFTDDNHDEIVVERNNIVIDGDGYTLQGTEVSWSDGIDLSGRTNVTVRNTIIKKFWGGVHLWESSNNSISGNNITANRVWGIVLTFSSNNNICGNNVTNNGYGISLRYSSNNSISGNNITNNNDYGIYLDDSSNYNSISGNNMADNSFGFLLRDSSNYNSISGNNMADNSFGVSLENSSNNNNISDNTITNNIYGIMLGPSSNYNSVSGNTFTNDGLYVLDSYHNVVEDNTVNGKPLVYLEGVADHSVGDAGQVILVNCTGIRVENLNLSRTSVGVQLWQASNSSIAGNTIANNHHGILLGYRSSSNRICGNNVTNNGFGIMLEFSSNNSVSGNNIAANNLAIRLGFSSNNRFYHNHFIDNSQQVSVYPSKLASVWDDGYPSGGNYWSDYNGTDANHDGIGDTAYFINANNTDNYPLMGTFNSYNVTYYTPPLVPHACNVTVISNSTISDFSAPISIEHPEATFLMFNASGAEGSTGFCRVSFPTAMMNGTYHVSVNGTEIPYTLLPCSDANYSYLYFTYTHPTETVIILPEFPSFFILPLFMVATLLAVIIHRRKYSA